MGFKTQRDVDRLSLPLGVADRFFFDDQCQGLSARLQGAKRSWVVHYTVDEKRRRLSLGDVSALSLADARNKAGQVVAGGKDGVDPLKSRATRVQQRADTLGGLVTFYLARYAEREQRPRTLVETTRALKVHLLPLHDLPLAEITRRDVAAQLQKLVDSSGPIMANRTRAALSHCYTWAMQQGLAETNPVVGTARPASETKRERTLSLGELRTVWLAAGDDDYGRIVKILILTGQRRDEVGGMSESELDRDSSLWVLPSERTKNGREHEVPLAPFALEIICDPRPGHHHVFGRGRAGFSGWSQSKVRLDTRIAATGVTVKPWTLHDLRRAVVTGMNDIGVEPHIVEAVVNHITGAAKAGVAGIYNHSKYRPQKRAAMERWAAQVEAVVELATVKRP